MDPLGQQEVESQRGKSMLKFHSLSISLFFILWHAKTFLATGLLKVNFDFFHAKLCTTFIHKTESREKKLSVLAVLALSG